MTATTMRASAQLASRAGSGAPMLLIHGLGSCAEVWDPILATVRSRHEVAVCNLPGFGGAPALAEPPTGPRLADAVEALLDELGWERAHLVGNSLGGWLSLELARRGRAITVTAISPAGGAAGWEHGWARTVLRTTHRLGRAIRPLMGRLASSAAGRTALMSHVIARPWLLTPDAALHHATRFVDADAVVPTIEALADLSVDAAAIDVPTTIAWGTRDALLFPRQGVRLKRANPAFRLVRLEGLGHTPMSDDPSVVADVVLRSSARA